MVGVPEIVNTPAEKLPDRPAGKVVTIAPVAPLPTVYLISMMVALIHKF